MNHSPGFEEVHQLMQQFQGDQEKVISKIRNQDTQEGTRATFEQNVIPSTLLSSVVQHKSPFAVYQDQQSFFNYLSGLSTASAQEKQSLLETQDLLLQALERNPIQVAEVAILLKQYPHSLKTFDALLVMIGQPPRPPLQNAGGKRRNRRGTHRNRRCFCRSRRRHYH